MLFAVKRRVGPAAALAVGATALSLLARDALGLSWRLELGGAVVAAVATLGLLATADGLLHLGLARALGRPYHAKFRGLAEFYRGQSRPAVLAGGALAAAEELLFRGVVLGGLVAVGGLDTPAAVVGSALAFGAAHYHPRLGPFAAWAVWEGALLGAAYVLTGSLVGVAAAHAIHDVGGFWLLARVRRGAWVPPWGGGGSRGEPE